MREHLPGFLRWVGFALGIGLTGLLLHVYLHRRLFRDTTTRGAVRAAGGVLLGAGALLVFAAPGGMRAGLAVAVGFSAAGVVERTGYLWWGVLAYLLLSLGAFELVRLAVRRLPARRRAASPAEDRPEDPSRREALSRVGAAVAVAATGAALGRGIPEALGPPVVRDVTVRLPRLPPALSGLVIAHLTDLHAGAWVDRAFVARLVERTNALEPDLVALTGDLVDGSVARVGPVLEPLAGLRARRGTYFCAGNHEYYSGLEEWTEWLRRRGIVPLRNARTTIGEGRASFDLAGVDDWSGGRGRGPRWDLDAALAGRDPRRALVLLAHQPRGFERAAAAGVGLQLSGHTHGGQLWPWTYVVSAVYHPYARGLHARGASALFVSAGCGFWGPPVRLGVPPEIGRIVLTAA